MGKRIFSLLLTIVLIFSFMTQDFNLLAEQPGRTAANKSNLLAIQEQELSQNGEKVATGASIEVTQKVGFSVEVKIPIKGDFTSASPLDWDNFVIKGDTAEIILAENFKLLEEVKNVPILGSKIGSSQKEYTVGHVDFVQDGNLLKAKIRFDGDDAIFDGSLSNLQAWISGEVYEKREESEITTSNPIIKIFNKNYRLSYRPQIEANIKKELVLENGALKTDHINQRILEWKVVVNAHKKVRDQQLPVDLGGYILADIFSQEEATKTGAFKTIGTTADEKIKVNDQEKVLTRPATPGGFEYVFEPGTQGEQTIIFHTTFEGKELFQPEVNGSRDYKKKNTVKLLDRSRTEVAVDTAEATLKSLDLFYKGTTGQSSDSVPVPGKPLGHYYHTWQLIVNKQGIRMENVAVIDKMITNADPATANQMKFISAHWEELKDAAAVKRAKDAWKKNPNTIIANSEWKKIESIPEYTEAPADFTYAIGNIDAPRRLVIKTYFNLENYDSVSKRYDNTFYPKWDAMTTVDAEKRPVHGYMQVGPKPMVKSPSSVPHSFRKNWTITIRPNATNTYTDLRVFDILPFSPEFANRKENREELKLADGTKHLHGIAIKDMFHKETNSAFQKYVGNFETVKGDVELTVHKLYNSKNAYVADLLEFKGKSKDPAQPAAKVDEWKFSYHTESFNTELVFDNSGQRRDMLNTATLFDGTTRIDESKVTNGFYPDMLKKEMLAAKEWQSGEQNWTAQLVNQVAVNERRGYHHGENAVIYRISINNGNHQHLLDAFGGIKLTDTLPAGWEFVKMTDTDDYLVFAAEPETAVEGQRQSVKAKGEPVRGLNITTNSFIGKGEAVLTIAENLRSPYVLLLKAAPKAKSLQNYVKDYARTGNEVEVTNRARLEPVKNLQNLSENKKTVTAEQKVSFAPIVLDKFSDAEFRPAGANGVGVLEWTIEYSPRKLELSAGATDLWLVDQLQGQMVLKQENGRLVIPGKFLFAETVVNGDGSLGENTRLLPLVEGDNLFYDPATKILKVKLPDKDKAYRLVYEADVSRGTPLVNVRNTVVLQGTDVQVEKRSQAYRVDQYDARANYELNSLVEVIKVDGNGHPLKDAEFTLTAPDGTEQKKTTNQLGILRFINLLPGTEYRLKETKAPTGYHLATREYSVKVDGDGKVSIDGEIKKTVIVENTSRIPLKINVVKKWYGTKKTPVTVKLYNNKNQMVDSVVLTEDSPRHTFTDYELDQDGSLLRYRVTEEPVPAGNHMKMEAQLDTEGYLVFKSIGGKKNADVTIVNTGLVDVTVEKRWIGDKKEAVTLHLLQDGVRLAGLDSLVLNRENNWTGRFPDLPKYNSKGLAHVYSVEEDADSKIGYEVKVETGKDNPYQLIVTNQQTTPKPESPKPYTPKPEEPKPETPKPEEPKSETPKPETPKSEEPKPETPKPEEPKPQPELTPERPTPEGELDIPDGDVPRVLVPPKNGIIEFDGNRWKYIPDPKFYGKEKILIQITKPDGSEYQQEIEIDIPVPQGVGTLPETSGIPASLFWLVGSAISGIALLFKRRKDS